MTVDVDVALGGTVFCDLVFSGTALPEPGTEVFSDAFALTAGGTATRACTTARLGMRTALLAVLGRDVFGDQLCHQLAAEPLLDLRWVQRSETAHTALTVAVTDGHERSFITYEEPGTAAPDTWPGVAPAATTCHVGVARNLPAWVAPMRTAGTVVFAGVGWDPSHAWSATMLDRLGGADILVLNEIEALSYTRSADVPAAARLLAARVPTVVVTRGARGALAVDSASGAWIEQQAPDVPVVDPTGAGDVFTGALMTATVLGWDLADRVRLAVLAASLSVRTPGGAISAPRPPDIAAAMATTPRDRAWSTIRDWLAELDEADPGAVTTTPIPKEAS